MIFHTELRDCLFLNWALPADSLPEPPDGLRWERQPAEGGDLVFASSLLFRQEGMRLSHLPLPRLSYPQLNLRLYVQDAEGMPSVLFLFMLVPGWVVPAARWVARQPAQSARFRYPDPDRLPDEEARWRVEQRGCLEVSARPGAPRMREGSGKLSWDGLVERLKQRQRGYVLTTRGLRQIATKQPRSEAVPMSVTVDAADLLPPKIGDREIEWPELHSAWLCPRMPYVFEVGPSLAMNVPRPRPATLGNCTREAARRASCL